MLLCCCFVNFVVLLFCCCVVFVVNCLVLVVNFLVMFLFLLLTVLFYVLFVCKCVLYYCHRVSTQLELTNVKYHTRAVLKVSSYAMSYFMYIMFLTLYVPVTVVLHYLLQSSVPFTSFHFPTYILSYFYVSSTGCLSFICYKLRPIKPIYCQDDRQICFSYIYTILVYYFWHRRVLTKVSQFII